MLERLFKIQKMDDATYIRYFNYGYFLAESEPVILGLMLEAKIEEMAVQKGLEDGRIQYENEQKLMRILEIEKQNDKDFDKER